jgi:hypothetical protein
MSSSTVLYARELPCNFGLATSPGLSRTGHLHLALLLNCWA